MGCGSSKSPVLAPQANSAAYKQLPSEPSKEQNNNNPDSSIPEKAEEEIPEANLSDLDELHISFEKAASLRLNTPGQMWAAVRKTCSPNKKWKIETNKSRRGWKTIRLFVSSTFKDFHVEREVLVKEVRLALDKGI